MSKQVVGGEIEIEHEAAGLQGRPCVTVSFGPKFSMKLRMTLEDAETIGDGLIKAVRQAEEATER